MIAFADRRERLDPHAGYARLGRLAAGEPEEGWAEGLILAGQLESGITDAWCPDGDDADPRLAPVRAVTLGFARALLGHRRDRVTPPDGLPAQVEVSVPEGFAWYALFPEAYAEAAAGFAREVAPGPAVVLGLRTVGASLSAGVHAALEARGWPVASYTVRPRGHPFDRTVRLGPALRRAVVRARWVLVVDEGPGLSGSSLCGTAAAVAALGVPDEAIVLVPAWCPDGAAFRSAAARSRWPRHRKVVADSGALVERWVGGEDWSAGAWRAALGAWPAVHPQHERVKRRIGDRVARFAGLGPYGRAVVARAERLAEAGVGPPVLDAGRGFVVHPRLIGRPAGRGDLGRVVPALIRRLEVARRAPMPRGASADELWAMIEHNLAAAGLPVPRPDRRRGLADHGAVAIDGRLAAHEWILTPSGVVKTDGVDHCADHFLPGPQDLAWDVAGAGIELGPAARDAVLDALGDRGLRARVPVYEVAYAALRIGYATLAREAVGGAERDRWTAELARLHRAAGRAVAELG